MQYDPIHLCALRLGSNINRGCRSAPSSPDQRGANNASFRASHALSDDQP
jgi:hypothetical protein